MQVISLQLNLSSSGHSTNLDEFLGKQLCGIGIIQAEFKDKKINVI